MTPTALVLSLLITTALALPSRPAEDKILNGVNARVGQFPYQVAMRSRSSRSLHCGGGILSNNVVLTAAHCVYGQYSSDYLITAGTIDLRSGGSDYNVASMVYHAGFNYNELFNDIALITISGSFSYNTNVQPLTLPSSGLNLPEGATVTAVGWGLTSYPSNTIPNILQTTGLPVVSNSACQSLLGTIIAAGQICAGGIRGTGMCNGDSGSPLGYNGVIVGLVSWGQPCAQGYPDVFTRVSAYLDWINYNLPLLEQGKAPVMANVTGSIAPPGHIPPRADRFEPPTKKIVSMSL